MSRHPALLLVIAFVCCVSGGLLPQNALAQGSVRSELPNDIMLGRLGLQRAWWSQASIDPLEDRVKDLLSDEQVTVVQSKTGLVSVLDNANGRRLWSVQVGLPNEMHLTPATNERLVLVIAGTKMHGLDKRTGNVAWEVNIPTAASA